MEGKKMAKRMNLQTKKLEDWNAFKDSETDAALENIYNRVCSFSEEARDWYWKHIAKKRSASLFIRFISFLLVLCGAVAPIVSGILENYELRLFLTQTGVILLAVAGLLQGADKVFGWSSGWLRYVTTVTSMESATKKFELAWANYCISNDGDFDNEDKKILFQLAKQFNEEIDQLKNDETGKWVVEFNKSTTYLNELIKKQRGLADKALVDARQAVQSEAAAKTETAREKQKGAIEMHFNFTTKLEKLKIRIDDKEEEEFSGLIWAKLDLSPRMHRITITTEKNKIIQKAVNIPAGEVAVISVDI